MREISLNDFLECYKPTCNECTPYPESLLTILMGKVIWDKRDYSRIASNLTSKHIVTGKQIGRASCRERVLRLV